MDSVEAPVARRTSKRPSVQSAHALRDLRETTPTCTHCRKNKLKCSGERPQCTTCVTRNGSCEYEEPTRAPSTRAAAVASTARKRPAPTSTYAQIKESRQRKRAAAAQTSCDFCRNDLRRKCDGLRPSCQSCIKRGEPCVYSGPASIPVTASSSTVSLAHMSVRSDDEDSDVPMPSRSHSPDIPLADSPTTPLDPNGPRYPQGNGLGHAGSARNPDGTNCTRPVACFFCIKVEIPCTGDFPTCVNCVRRNIPCTYPEPSSYAHQFPRQSAMHTRQLKDTTPHRASTSGAHTSPTRGQQTVHPSRSHPGPLNQLGPTPPPPISVRTSASPETHSRQRSLSGPNGLPGFGAEAIRSASGSMDNMPRSTSGHRSSISTTSPSRPPAPAPTHSRTPSTPSQSTLTNPIPLPTPVPRSTAQSPPRPAPPPIKTYGPLPASQPEFGNGYTSWTSQAGFHAEPAAKTASLPRPYPPSERVIGDVRAPPGDASSPVNGVIVSPSGRTRDASLVHSKSNSGSNGPTDGFVHEGPASYRARMEEGDVVGASVGSTTGRPITEEPNQIIDPPSRNGPTSPNRPRRGDEQAPGPVVAEARAEPGPSSAPSQETIRPESVTPTVPDVAATAVPSPTLRTGSGTTTTAITITELRPIMIASDQRLPPLPSSVPRRPSVPSPITQHPARDMSIIAPMGRYDPRRDIGVDRRDSGSRDDRRDDRRDSTSNDRRGSTAGRDPVNNWQPVPRANTQPRPVPLNSTRRDRDNSPHTPQNQTQPLPATSAGQVRERSPPPSRKSGSPAVPATTITAAAKADTSTPKNNRSRAGSRRRSQSPRGLYLRAESGSIRSSPMDMDSS